MAEYVCEIIAACMKVFRMEASSAVRDSSIHTLLAALDLHEHVPDQAALRALLFPSVCDPLRNPSSVQLYWGHLSKSKSDPGSSETVRGGCMRLLGRLALVFPVQVSDDPVYERGMLYRTCEASLTKPGVGQPEVTGALEGLDGLLADRDSLKPQQLADAFRFASSRLTLHADGGADGDTIKRFGTPKAALGLLGRHLPLFAAHPGTPLALDAATRAAAAAAPPPRLKPLGLSRGRGRGRGHGRGR